LLSPSVSSNNLQIAFKCVVSSFLFSVMQRSVTSIVQRRKNRQAPKKNGSQRIHRFLSKTVQKQIFFVCKQIANPLSLQSFHNFENQTYFVTTIFLNLISESGPDS
jgi:hypothetical protein